MYTAKRLLLFLLTCCSRCLFTWANIRPTVDQHTKYLFCNKMTKNQPYTLLSQRRHSLQEKCSFANQPNIVPTFWRNVGTLSQCCANTLAQYLADEQACVGPIANVILGQRSVQHMPTLHKRSHYIRDCDVFVLRC